MRKIKFRGRRTTDGKYVYGQYAEVMGADGKIYSEIINRLTYNEKWYDYVFPDTVSQLVGYDEDGNEIYEGDEVYHREEIWEDDDTLEYEDIIEGKAYLKCGIYTDREKKLVSAGDKIYGWYK